ncbi:hypothetical protein RRSWK_06399 [Rhodopirellula sp. SWK7]|nr:hypothetical protein RRSWK_06399 [Rhodopirellula sp. SWK7]
MENGLRWKDGMPNVGAIHQWIVRTEEDAVRETDADKASGAR